MPVSELVEYLKEIEEFNISPWVVVMEKIEAIGDPATPSREHTAILRWLGKALEIWEKQYPLDSRLAALVRQLKPLSAALAVTDPKFMQPGAHPLHQLLDAIQARAIGWQARLDRVGAMLEQQVTRSVEESRQWFADSSRDLAVIAREFSSGAERDQARAKRMVQRIVETETGKVRTAAAKEEAARMINAALEKYPAPEDIGEFLKGPWYISAQLLLLKFGADSEHWKNMSATTEILLDSLQSLDDADETRRQYIFALVTRLPKDMRRWLLSLHHDTEAVNEAMGLVEFTHLRILRRQPVDLQRIDPIVVEDVYAAAKGAQRKSNAVLNALKKWPEGQWFIVERDGGVMRVQLVLKIEQSQQLLFTNMAGIKVLQLSYAEFDAMLTDRKATPLYGGASFSLCLAQAAGVDSVEILDALASALADSEPEPTPQPVTRPTAKPGADREEKIEPDFAAELDNLLEPVFEGDSEAGSDSEAEFDPPSIEELQEYIPDTNPEQATAPAAPAEYPPDSGLSTSRNDTPVPPQPAPSAKTGQGFLSDLAMEIGARGGYTPTSAERESARAEKPAPSTLNKEDGRRFLSDSIESSEKTPEPVEANEGPDREVNLPMGIWIGFHDGETPMMARMAVHDLDNNRFIFVNRRGVKVREVSRREMLSLIDNGLVDILETSSDFREKVTGIKKKLDN